MNISNIESRPAHWPNGEKNGGQRHERFDEYGWDNLMAMLSQKLAFLLNRPRSAGKFMRLMDIDLTLEPPLAAREVVLAGFRHMDVAPLTGLDITHRELAAIMRDLGGWRPASQMTGRFGVPGRWFLRDDLDGELRHPQGQRLGFIPYDFFEANSPEGLI